MQVIATLSKNAQLARFYEINWQVIPNLTMDFIVPPLARVMNIYLAGQAYIVAMFALIISGVLVLNRALIGRWSVLPLFAIPLLYNYVFLVGLMNYIFGIGVALWALASWVATRDRPWPLRYLLSTFSVVVLFFCHLSALGIYAIGILSFEIFRLWMQRAEAWPRRIAEFVAGGLPFLAVAPLLYASPTMPGWLSKLASAQFAPAAVTTAPSKFFSPERLIPICAVTLVLIVVVSASLIVFNLRNRVISENERALTNSSLIIAKQIEQTFAAVEAVQKEFSEDISRLSGLSKKTFQGHLGRYDAHMRDGRYIAVVHRPLSDGGWVATHEDVTETKRREESFRLLFEGSPVPMWVIDSKTLQFLAVNEAAIALYGYSRAQFMFSSPKPRTKQTPCRPRSDEKSRRLEPRVRFLGGL